MAEGYCLDEFCPTGYTQDLDNRACVGGGKIFEMNVRGNTLSVAESGDEGFDPWDDHAETISWPKQFEH